MPNRAAISSRLTETTIVQSSPLGNLYSKTCSIVLVAVELTGSNKLAPPGQGVARRHLMPPFALEIAASDFAFTAGHRRIAISLRAGRDLVAAAAFSMAAASCLDLTQPDGFAGDLVDVPADRLRWFGLLGHAESVGQRLGAFNRGAYPRQLVHAASCFAFAKRLSRSSAW
jgi:hypothetical protein